MRASEKTWVPAPWPGPRLVPPTLKRCAAVGVSLLYFLLHQGRSRSHPARLVILYYHTVPEGYRARFAAQLDRIHAGADRVVPAGFTGSAPPGHRLVAITFDDGFVSVAEHALPELRARGWPTTIFVPSGALGRAPSWVMEAQAEGRTETIMTAAQLRAIAGELVEIGSHTVSHPSLTAAAPYIAEQEISLSKRKLAGVLGREVDLFSFPYGDHDTQTVRFCRAGGYRFAFTSDPACIDPSSAQVARGRTVIRIDDTLVEFWLKMRGAYAWQPTVRAARHQLVQVVRGAARRRPANAQAGGVPNPIMCLGDRR